MDPTSSPCSCSPSTHSAEPTFAGRLSRRAVVAGGLALGATPLVVGWFADAAGADSNLYNTPDLRTRAVRPIMFPIVPKAGTSVNRLRNYGDDRGSHIHAGEDMMSAKLSLLLAVTDGVVVRKVFASGGNYLYLRGDDGWHYGYLHINNDTPGTDDGRNPAEWAFAPGIEEGVRVARGQQIAWVGDSGNAEASGSHLHFEIRKPSSKWYWSQAVDPAPSLDAADPAVPLGDPSIGPTSTTTTPPPTTTTPPPPPASPYAPFASAAAFASQQHLDFLGRTPTSSWLNAATRDLTRARTSPEALVERLVNDRGVTTVVNPVIRLYQAYFGGIPTFEGVRYWVNVARAGTPLDTVSAQLMASSKFKSKAGRLDNAGFARLIYTNLYGKAPTAKVQGELVTMLDHGTPRNILVRAMCETIDYRARSANRTRVISVYHLMLHRSPTNERVQHWAAIDARSRTGLQSLIAAARNGSEYAARF